MVFRRLVSLVVPASVAFIAFLQVRAIGTLVDTTVAPASIAPFAEAREAASARSERRARSTAIAANDTESAGPADPRSAPLCEGVQAVASTRAPDDDGSLATLALRRPGGDVTDLRVVHVAADRIWLERNGVLCQAPVLSRAEAPPAKSAIKTAGFALAVDRRMLASLGGSRTARDHFVR